MQVEEISSVYSNEFSYSKAHAHIDMLEQQGFQPGSILTANSRDKVLRNLSAGMQQSS